MPVYLETWDETKPQGTRDRALGDDDIREFKRAIRERLAEDHFFADDESGVDEIGYHRKVTLFKHAGNPTVASDSGIVFAKDVGSGVIELFFIDAVGNVTQLTSAGQLLVLGASGFRAGDKLLSSNTNTPTGWVDQSATYDNHFIRISTGTPLTTGGANTHDHGAVTGSHTLTGAESGVPAHTHSTTNTRNENGWSGGNFFQGSQDGVNSPAGTALTVAANTAADAASGHTHTISSANNVPVYVQMRMYSKT